MSEAVYLVLTVTPKPAEFQEVLDAFKEVAEATKTNEDGALVYLIFPNQEEGKIVLYEKYKDQAAYDLHTHTELFKKLKDQSVEKLTQPPVWNFLKNPIGFER